MKKLLLGILIGLIPILTPISTMADTILGFKVGAGSWSHDPSGVITSSVNGIGTSANLENDLNLAEENEGYVYFSLEHPIPLVPNIKFIQTNLTSLGSGNVTSTFDFNGTTFSKGAAVTTKLDLNQTDTIFYYEILDNVISFDVGLNAKYIDGEAVVTEGGTTKTATFDGYVPMLYAAAEISLPADLTLGIEVSNISSGNDSFSDITTKISYTTDFMLGIEAGLRTQSIKVDVDSVKTDIEFKGIFAGINFKF